MQNSLHLLECEHPGTTPKHPSSIQIWLGAQMRKKSQSLGGLDSGVRTVGQDRPLAPVGTLACISLTLYLSPKPSQKNCRNCFWSKWSFGRSWSGNSRVSKVLPSPPLNSFPNLPQEVDAGACPRGEKNSRAPCFQLGEGLDGGGSRGEDGREREVEPGEEAVLNSSHLINLHR